MLLAFKLTITEAVDMEAIFCNYNTVQSQFSHLSRFLLTGKYEQLWPLASLDETEVSEWLFDLYLLCWECISMQQAVNMPPLRNFTNQNHAETNYPDAIRITRALVQVCNDDLITAYRPLTLNEHDIIQRLQQVHNALIGHHYFQHPGMETVSAHEVRFFKG